MRQTELFDAYLSGEMTEKMHEDLAQLLESDDGSKAFVEYMSESHLLCESLKHLEESSEEPICLKKTSRTGFYMLAIAACLLFTFMIFNEPQQESPIINQVKVVDQEIQKFYAENEKTFSLDDGSEVRLEAGSELKVINENHLVINSGTYNFKINDRSGKKPLKIDMTHGFLEILGTEFSVIDNQQSSWVHVSEGIVKVVVDDDIKILEKGHSIEVTEGQLVSQFLDGDLEIYFDGTFNDDGNIIDLSGKNRPGIVKKDITEQQDGAGAYLSFNKLGHAWIENFELSAPFSISIWVKLREQKNRFETIIGKGDTSWRLSLYEDTTNLHFAITGLAPEFINSKKSIKRGVWNFISAVYDGSEMKLFINGELDVSASVTGEIAKNIFPIELGGNNEKLFRNLQGDLDECRIYSRALSAEEVKRLYYSGR